MPHLFPQFGSSGPILSLSKGRDYADHMSSRLRPYIVPTIVLLTVLVLILFPRADCFDCDFPHPWGRDDAAYALRSEIFLAWLAGTSFFFGLYRVRGGWIARR